MRFAFVQTHEDEHHVTTMCRVLLVSKAGYYAWVTRRLSEHATADEQLAEEIRQVHKKSRGTYGSPRVQEALKGKGQRHGRKRIARLMRKQGLRAKTPRRYRQTTDSNHPHPIAPNTWSRSPPPTACG
jgi:putative transposase